MEPEGSLPRAHVPLTCPYPEPARSSPALNTFFKKLNIIVINELW